MRNLYFLILLVFSQTIYAQNIQEPVLIPCTGESKITIDGKLSPKEWDNAKQFELQVSTGEHVDYFQPTKAYLTWNDSTIFVAFSVKDSHIMAKERARDDDVYYDDCVEVFLAPIHQYDSIYFGWEMNSKGQFSDFVFFPHHIQSSSLILTAFSPPGVKVATTKMIENNTITGWEHELSIPVTAFSNFVNYGPLKDGAQWKFQLSRWDHQQQTKLFSSYTITGEPSPHVFSKMAVLEFEK